MILPCGAYHLGLLVQVVHDLDLASSVLVVLASQQLYAWGVRLHVSEVAAVLLGPA